MPGDWEGLFSQAQRWKKELEGMKSELASRTIQIGRPPAVITVNGLQEVLSLQLDLETLARQDSARVEKVLVGLLNEALRSSRGEAKKELGRLAGGLPIQGLLDLL